MKIAVAGDHGGFALKGAICSQLRGLGHQVLDLGAHKLDPSDDYPDFARYLGQVIQHEQADRGILICSSGVGATVAANKLRGIRAGLCHDIYSAGQGVEHDNMNVLCLGAGVVGEALAIELVQRFVAAEFSGTARHLRRLEKVDAIEAAG